MGIIERHDDARVRRTPSRSMDEDAPMHPSHKSVKKFLSLVKGRYVPPDVDVYFKAESSQLLQVIAQKCVEELIVSAHSASRQRKGKGSDRVETGDVLKGLRELGWSHLLAHDSRDNTCQVHINRVFTE